jgi:hypothetical protein
MQLFVDSQYADFFICMCLSACGFDPTFTMDQDKDTAAEAEAGVAAVAVGCSKLKHTLPQS